MAVPAHDTRDLEFAQKFNLPVRIVVQAPAGVESLGYVGDGVNINSDLLDGLPTPQAKQTITRWLEDRQLGRRMVNYKLRDWLFSRQRYWGEPFPIVWRKGSDGHWHHEAVTERDLPVLPPDLLDFKPTSTGEPPLARAKEWLNLPDGSVRETNTMPQWAGSCWYYLRFLDPHNDAEIFSQKAYDDWMPVDLYMGGSEHAVLHLLYARFWHKVLFDIGVVKHPEPFSKLVHQGMILGEPQMTAYRDGSGAYVSADLAKAGDDDQVVNKETGVALEPVKLDESAVEKRAGHFVLKDQPAVKVQSIAFKMSKSRGNVVNPDDVVRDAGADSLRVYEMFMGPLEQVKPWQTAGIQGVRRFLDRVHTLSTRELSVEMDAETAKLVHRTVKKVGEDIEALRFNTAISAMMILVNHLNGLERTPREALEKLVLCLSPFAPHLGEEVWAGLGHAPTILDAPWPVFDPQLCVDEQLELAVQVNGKVRGRALLAKDASEDAARAAALADENVRRHTEGKVIRKVVYVPGRVLNLIVS
jgi:leucyl-tRNA synthetase